MGRLEFERTREVLSRYLPSAPCDVLDVGGGAGVHAEWLTADGHRVHVVGPQPEHVAGAGALPGVTASIGDARSLAQPDAGADVVLLLGPLYHLMTRADRVTALRGAVRVTRSGGLIAAAAIARYASLLDITAQARLTDAAMTSLFETVRTGVHDPAIGFTEAYFHTRAELVDEFADARLDAEVIGLEGPGYPMLKVAELNGVLTENLYASVRRLACAVERSDALADVGSHLLAIAHVP